MHRCLFSCNCNTRMPPLSAGSSTCDANAKPKAKGEYTECPRIFYARILLHVFLWAAAVVKHR